MTSKISRALVFALYLSLCIAIYQPIQHCIQESCSPQTCQCDKCQQGYELINYSVCQAIRQSSTNDQKTLIEYHRENNVQTVTSQTNLKNCLSQSLGLCIACQQDYLLREGYCLIGFRGCEKVQNTLFDKKCLKCAANFQLKEGKCYDPNCLLISGYTDLCYQCKENFIYDETIQGCIDPNCKQVQDGNCIRCQSNFYKVQHIEVCISKIPQHCKKYPSIECNLCEIDEFRLINGTCISFITGCKDYSAFKGQCIKCQQGLQIEYNKCVDRNCLRSNNAYPCQKCKQGFKLNQKMICQPINCEIIISQKCEKCSSGYHMNSKRICQQNQLNCINQDYIEGCIQCINGYQLLKGQCLPPYCQVYTQNKRHCMKCIQGYHLNEQFDRISYYQSYCLQEEEINGRFRCTKYKDQEKFYIEKKNYGICRDPYCQELSQNRCQKCLWGYYLGQEGNCIQKLPVNNCLKYHNNKTCKICQNGFINRDGICHKLPNGCISIDQTGECKKCMKDYFYYEEEKICLEVNIENCLKFPNQLCDLCPQNYKYTTFGCIPQMIGCAYQQKQNQCLQCIKGLILQNQTCIDPNCADGQYPNCSNCDQGYIPNSEGICQDLNCAEYGNSQCLQCKEGYQLQNGICQQIFKTKACQWYELSQYQSIPLCGKCSVGYSVWKNKCYVDIDNCSIRNPSNPLKCGKCIQGYYVDINLQCKPLEINGRQNRP